MTAPQGGAGDRDPRYGWAIVAALASTEMVSWGVLYYAFAVLLTPMKASLGMSTLALTGAFSLALAVSGLMGLAVGRWLDQYSPRLLMSAGSMAATLLILAWSRIGSIVDVYIVFVGVGFVMATVLYEPAFIVVSKWFRIRRREALTIVTLVGALASFIFSPLTQYLTASFGWRAALTVLAAILFFITVPLHALILRPAPRLDRRVEIGAADQRKLGNSFRPGFRLLTLPFVLGAFTTSAISIHLVALTIAAGQSAAFAATIAGLVGISQIPGRVVFAVFGRRLSGGRLPAAVFGLATLALVVLAFDQSPAALVSFAVLFGMSGGMATLLRAALVGELYGQEAYGRNSSIASAFVTGARAIAPFAAAGVALLPGGYVTLTCLLAAASACAGIAAGRAVEEASRHALGGRVNAEAVPFNLSGGR